MIWSRHSPRGTGKATTILTFIPMLALADINILLVDLNPQANLTLTTLGDCSGASLAEVLGDI
jgi:cellulose biosynthesis protein BcsQ